ncbi:MAG TPA: DUF1552 domain-containing protein [Polyangia bacterium]|nr:DUF1552 domain-containing protein [Polyangia bacterium]
MISIRTSATRARFSRRLFLRGIGASAAFLPLLESERARAAAPGTGFPKRLITIAWGNGVALPSFYPAADDPTANTIMQPLASLKDKVTMVAGLDYKLLLDSGHTYDGHFTYPTMFTGTYKNTGGQSNTATGPSIDQVYSDAVAKQVNLPMPLLNITAQGGSTSYRANGVRNTGETKAARLFTTLFANRPASGSSGPSPLTLRRKSVLDYVTEDVTSFGTRLGTADRMKIAAHLDSIRKLETQLSAASNTASCMPVDPGNPADYPTSMKAFNDLVAMALRCDLTRSVSLTWADDGGSGPNSMPFIGVGDVHGVAHQGAAGYPTKIKIDTWYMTQLAYLANALNATAEGSGTVLDNSLIIMANDMTEGSFHSVSAAPIVLVGSAGGALRAGRTVKVGTWAGKTGNYWSSGKTGVPHNKLLASISNMLDVPTDAFGTGFTGTLTELT